DFSHPDSLEAARKRFEDLAMEKTAPPMEVKWITLDGRTIDVETAGVPARKNKRLLLQGFIRDLTERKKAAAKLEETAQRMQALFDRSLDPTLFFDDTGRYVDANPAASALLGYAREEIVTMSMGDFTPLEKKAAAIAIRDDLASSRSRQGEFAIVRKSGEVRDIEYATVANVVPGLHCLFMRDISARKAAEVSVRQLSARLLQSQDEERRRIARQLHDTTAQNLVALRMNLALIARSPAASDAAISEPLEESVALTELSIAEIRTLSYVLHPPMIEEAGLLPALRWYAQGFEERSGIKVTVDLPEQLEPLPIELATTLFRIVQEALSNAQRHSGSANAAIRIEQQSAGLHLEIEDTGRGMPQSLRQEDTLLLASGVGIAGMRERVLEHGGELHIQSRDSGTVVSVTIPLFEN
ncbi:MAG TPA: PAS domain S-box protein, partial [Thermoanaerobaculia bacterium]|nr:PAS domain S-box protein [Thermoanaerobaculia bacterium]